MVLVGSSIEGVATLSGMQGFLRTFSDTKRIRRALAIENPPRCQNAKSTMGATTQGKEKSRVPFFKFIIRRDVFDLERATQRLRFWKHLNATYGPRAGGIKILSIWYVDNFLCLSIIALGLIGDTSKIVKFCLYTNMLVSFPVLIWASSYFISYISIMYTLLNVQNKNIGRRRASSILKIVFLSLAVDNACRH